MPADGRVSAWLCAWKRLEHLDKAQRKDVTITGEMRDTTLKTVELYVGLANSSEDVGVAAGEILREEYEQADKAREHILQALRKVKDA